MVARVSTTSKCREKTKEPILAEEPEEIPLPYVPLYPPLPPALSSIPQLSTPNGEAQGTVITVKSGPETFGASTPLSSLNPMDPIPTLSPPVLTPHSPFNQLNASLREDPSSPQTPTAMQMPLREAQSPGYYDPNGQIQGGGRIFIYQPCTTTDLLNWKHHTPLSQKNLRL
jgi:hypothetical protein